MQIHLSFRQFFDRRSSECVPSTIMLIYLAALMVTAVNTPAHSKEPDKSITIFKLARPTLSTKIITDYTYKIIVNADGTFGYDVFAGNKLFVHQPTIPAVAGNKGFSTQAAAERIAELVLKKLKQGEVPPTIKIEEMQKLDAI